MKGKSFKVSKAALAGRLSLAVVLSIPLLVLTLSWLPRSTVVITVAALVLVAATLFFSQWRSPVLRLVTVLIDLLLISLVNYVSILRWGAPVFFPLYAVVAFESTWWWQWRGTIGSGLGGAALVGILCLFVAPCISAQLTAAVVAVTLGWAALLGYFAQVLRRGLARYQHWRPQRTDRPLRWERGRTTP